MLIVAIILLLIPVVFFDEMLGNSITGAVIADNVKQDAENLASFFPLTGFSGSGTGYCFEIGPDSVSVENADYIYTASEVPECDESYDFVLSFASADEFSSLLAEPSCAEVFEPTKFTYETSKFWNGDFVCDNNFKSLYCSGIDACSNKASAEMLSCCPPSSLGYLDGETGGDNLSADLPSSGADVSGTGDTSPPNETVYTKRPPVSGDIVGKASASATGVATYAAYIVVGVFLAVTVLGTIHARKKKRLERNRAVIKISLWAKKSGQLGYTPQQIAAVLKQRNVSDNIINESFKMAFGKR